LGSVGCAMRERIYPLPDREWLRLQEATTFAFYGVSFSSCAMTFRELREIDKRRAELNQPCIYDSIDFDDIAARRRVEAHFHAELSEAALSGRVRFQIEGKDIPIWQFKEPREFSLVDDTIRTKVIINGEPVVPHLREAMVERRGFLAWFEQIYPCCRTGASESAATMIGNSADTPAETVPASPGPEALRNAILQADSKLWPNGPPAGMLAKLRRDAIRRHLKPKIASISDRTFQRYGIGKT
jgi:hypothetical protein